MSKKFKDLILCAPGRPHYHFKCELITGARDRTPVRHSGACLSGFSSRVFNNRSKQTLRYTWPVKAIEGRWGGSKMRAQIGESTTIKDLRPILLKFYHLCRDHGMLPKDFRIPKTTNNFYIKNIHEMPPSLLYAYIAHLRDVDEEPYFIYNLLTLVENYDLNPWTSYVVASVLSIVGCGHHPLPISGNGGLAGRVRADSMFNLRDYFANPHKKDKRTLMAPGKSYISWSAHKHIDSNRYYQSPSQMQIMFTAREILENIKGFNKALGMEKKKGLAYLDESRKVNISCLRSYLYGLGYGVTPDYYEPWWLLMKIPTKKSGLALVNSTKSYIEAYLLEKHKYGASWDLKLRVKTRYIAPQQKMTRKNFKQAKKQSRYDDLEGVKKP